MRAEGPQEPHLAARVATQALFINGINRTYTLVRPDKLPPNAPLVLALHGARANGVDMRQVTGYSLDRLAVDQGFAVIYPYGHGQTWNDCRTQTPYPAREDDIDDVRFLSQLVESVATALDSDPARVFGFGYSNGGHMLYRMAAEAPGILAAMTVVSANLPSLITTRCPPITRPTAIALITGTSDPVNPYRGGVGGTALNRLDSVLSAEATAAEFARINGVDTTPVQTDVGIAPGQVWLTAYGDTSATPVRLYSVIGGGHTVPNPRYRAPRVLGATSRGIDAAMTAWTLFSYVGGYRPPGRR